MLFTPPLINFNNYFLISGGSNSSNVSFFIFFILMASLIKVSLFYMYILQIFILIASLLSQVTGFLFPVECSC